MYNYRKAVKEDVKKWMDTNLEHGTDSDYDTVYDACFVADEVTGNASGSYTFNRLEARKCFFEDEHAEDYLWFMVQDGFSTFDQVGRRLASGDWEWLDVCIRCFLLGEVIYEVLDERK